MILFTQLSDLIHCSSLIISCVSIGSPSSIYEYPYSAILCESRNIRICIGKTVFLKVLKTIDDLNKKTRYLASFLYLFDSDTVSGSI